MGKKTIALIFGGQSSEHMVSCMSAANIADLIDKETYDLLLIGITQEGRWLKAADVQQMRNGNWREGKISAVLLPDSTKQCILIKEGADYTKVKIDLVFPVLHGLYGEDGTIQGLCELAKIPYVGCGVLASAIGMDKSYTKIVVDALGIKQARYVLTTRAELEEAIEAVIERVEKTLPYPVFVKPCNAGSSKGVGKASDRRSLRFALNEAVLHDRKILIEEGIKGREIECAVLGTYSRIRASKVGEVIAAAEFYDFDAKYYNSESATVVDPVLAGDCARTIGSLAKRIFAAIDGFGLARVDFFVTERGEIIFNEINTMPGFTAISMYPMLWEASGIPKAELVKELIELAFRRE